MKLFIKNRHGKKMSVEVEHVKDSKGVVFIMHGNGGSKRQALMQVSKESFSKNKITCVLFDATNTFGESEGKYENATLTQYYEDLEDVIAWAKTQDFYKEPYYLVGHSLGGSSTILRSIKKPQEVKSVFPICSVVSGDLVLNQKFGEEKLRQWKEQGFLTWYSKSGEKTKTLNYTYVNDVKKYDLIKQANKIKTNMHFFVGEKDITTPPEHVKLLFDKISCKKTFDVIKKMPHAPKTTKGLEELRKKMNEYITKDEVLN